MRKILSGVLVVAMALSLTGCFGGGKTAGKVNGDAVSQAMLDYYILVAENALESANIHNDPDFWENGQIDGINAGEYARNYAINQIASSIAIRQQAIAMGHDLTEEDLASIDAARESTIEQYGGQAAYEEALARVGVTDELFIELTTLGKYEEVLYNTLRLEWSDDDLRTYYETQMFNIKHVLIQTVGPESGLPLSPEEIEEARTSINAIAERAQAGENFDTLVATYSEDPGSISQPGGYLMGKFNTGMVHPFFAAAEALPMGEISEVVETSFGFHLLKKYPADMATFQENIHIARNLYWMSLVQSWVDDATIKF